MWVEHMCMLFYQGQQGDLRQSVYIVSLCVSQSSILTMDRLGRKNLQQAVDIMLLTASECGACMYVVHLLPVLFGHTSGHPLYPARPGLLPVTDSGTVNFVT